MSREWTTPLSIVIGSGIVSLGLYFGLRPAPSSNETSAATPDLSANVRPGNRRAEEPPFVERDRHRGLDDDEDQGNDEIPPPAPEDPRREEYVPSAAEQAMAIASPLPSLPQSPGLAAQVEGDSAEAFDAVRSEARECWNSLPDDPEAPSSVSLDLSLSYDAEGNVIASGVSEDREARRDGLAQCLGPIVHGLRIPAPGSNASVQVRVTVP
jgi:hypothetical protein